MGDTFGDPFFNMRSSRTSTSNRGQGQYHEDAMQFSDPEGVDGNVGRIGRKRGILESFDSDQDQGMDQEELLVDRNGIDRVDRASSPASILEQRFMTGMWKIIRNDCFNKDEATHVAEACILDGSKGTSYVAIHGNTNTSKRMRAKGQVCSYERDQRILSPNTTVPISDSTWAHRITRPSQEKSSFVILRLLSGKDVRLDYVGTTIAAHKILSLLEDSTGANVSADVRLLCENEVLQPGDLVSSGARVCMLQCV